MTNCFLLPYAFLYLPSFLGWRCITFIMFRGFFSCGCFCGKGKKKSKITNQLETTRRTVTHLKGEQGIKRDTYAPLPPTEHPHPLQSHTRAANAMSLSDWSHPGSQIPVCTLWVAAGGRWTLPPLSLPMSTMPWRQCSPTTTSKLLPPGMWIAELCVYLQRKTWLPCKARN